MRASWKTWCLAASVRAVKTFAQSLLATLAVQQVGIGVTDVSWATVVSVASLAAVISLLTSLAGLPEVTSATE
jgi:hypothetical protein